VTVYLCIAGVGFVVLLASYALGGHGELSDHDVGHGAEGASPLSLKIIAIFAGIFGVVGAIVRAYGGEHHWAILGGTASGILAAIPAYWLVRALEQNQSTTEYSERALVGREGTVVVAIPAAGLGQVQVAHGLETVTRPARSADGKPVAAGAVVKVERRAGAALVVGCCDVQQQA
jgi:membrane protein implicated in regulation of membrane protease activity